MKKLNNREITTLAKKIYDDLSSPIISENEEIKDYNNNLRDEAASNISSQFQAFEDSLKDSVDFDDYHWRQFKNNMRNRIEVDGLKELINNPYNKSKIENEVILAQIGAEDLDSLINTVKSKFE